jgi:hypothetical protein
MGRRWHWTSGRIYIFLWKGNENHELGTSFFIHKRIVSALKRVEFASDRMSYIILRGHWCNIIVLNVHAPIERIMLGLKKRDSCRDWFKEMKILPLCSQYIYSLMFYIINNIHLFVRNTEVHNINTRQKINLFLPSTSFTKVQKGAYYSGIKIYDHLPRELKQLSNDPKSFEPALKRFLHTNYFYTLNKYFNYRC